MDAVPVSMASWMKEVPDPDFWKDEDPTEPDYCRNFANYLRALYPSGSIPIADLESGKMPNPSSFQRSLAFEARRRQGWQRPSRARRKQVSA